MVVDEEQRRMKEALMVNYLVFHWGSHTSWAFKYILCESLNLLNVVLQVLVTDSFLGGQFVGYGPRVVRYLRHGAEEDADPMDQVAKTTGQIKCQHIFRRCDCFFRNNVLIEIEKLPGAAISLLNLNLHFNQK